MTVHETTPLAMLGLVGLRYMGSEEETQNSPASLRRPWSMLGCVSRSCICNAYIRCETYIGNPAEKKEGDPRKSCKDDNNEHILKRTAFHFSRKRRARVPIGFWCALPRVPVSIVARG